MIEITEKLEQLYSKVSNLPQGALKTYWDTLLDSGMLYYSFGDSRISSDTFWPTKDIVPDESTGYRLAGQYMFYNAGSQNNWSLKDRLHQCGVRIVLDKVTSIRNLFNYDYFPEVPFLDCSTITASDGMQGVFSNTWGRLKVIEGIRSSAQTMWNANTFNNSYIEHCPIEGVIESGTFDIHWSTKLDKESIVSIINCLSDNASGQTASLSLTAVKSAFNTTDPDTCAEWQELIAPKTADGKWIISLV